MAFAAASLSICPARPAAALVPQKRFSAPAQPRPAQPARGLRKDRVRQSVVRMAMVEGLEPGMGKAPLLEGPTAVSRIVEVAPSWEQLRLNHLTALSSTMGTGEAKLPGDLKARCLAMSQLSDQTTWEVMDTPDVIGVYSDAYDGGLGDCATIVDTHVRLLADRLLRGDCSLTTECYAKLEALPPALKKQQTAATAAVGAAALLQIRENAELFRSMLAVAEEGERDEEARAEFLASSALCESIDDMLKAMPQPKE